jgi:hypothetical protein
MKINPVSVSSLACPEDGPRCGNEPRPHPWPTQFPSLASLSTALFRQDDDYCGNGRFPFPKGPGIGPLGQTEIY